MGDPVLVHLGLGGASTSGLLGIADVALLATADVGFAAHWSVGIEARYLAAERLRDGPGSMKVQLTTATGRGCGEVLSLASALDVSLCAQGTAGALSGAAPSPSRERRTGETSDSRSQASAT